MLLFVGCKQEPKHREGLESYPLMTVTPEDRELSVKYSAVIEGRQGEEMGTAAKEETEEVVEEAVEEAAE